MKRAFLWVVVATVVAVSGCAVPNQGGIITDHSEYCLYADGGKKIVDPLRGEGALSGYMHSTQGDGLYNTFVGSEKMPELEDVALSTKRGIEIGDSIQDVIEAYGDCEVDIGSNFGESSTGRVLLKQYAQESALNESKDDTVITVGWYDTKDGIYVSFEEWRQAMIAKKPELAEMGDLLQLEEFEGHIKQYKQLVFGIQDGKVLWTWVWASDEPIKRTGADNG